MFYYLVNINVFCFGIFGAYVWNTDFKTFEKQGADLFEAGLNGTVSDALTVLTNRDKKKGKPIMIQEISFLLDQHMDTFKDADNSTYRPALFTCIIQIYLLGIAVQMNRMGFK